MEQVQQAVQGSSNKPIQNTIDTLGEFGWSLKSLIEPLLVVSVDAILYALPIIIIFIASALTIKPIYKKSLKCERKIALAWIFVLGAVITSTWMSFLQIVQMVFFPEAYFLHNFIK